ncbi:hypothetical protein H2201_001054 [Coniosporium apollinis]|uniref:SWIM-type domain-containing protein n=1 Tax=Coniosporium apollinis TaxID=61459 RepID=A0ABQ9P404_9PEZI|nr:hypothetical protein H2201_001054 [Coniosporium apollinis]
MASSSMNERIIRSGRFRYDISGLSEASRERFRDALECGKAISVEYCEETEEAGSYVFHVKDTFPIFVEKDEPQLDKPQSDEPHPSAPHCDCGMWEEGLACKHVFWLEDQLVRAFGDESYVYRLAGDASTIENKTHADTITPYRLIERRELSELAKRRDWLLDEQGLEEGEARTDELNDILSVLEPTGLIHEDFVATLPGSPSLSQAYQQFRDSIIAYAARNDGLYVRLRSIVDPTIRANVFFERMQDRVEQVFDDLQEYVNQGPTGSERPFGVVECADKLEELVKEIQDGYDKRISNDPGDRDAANRAVRALIDVLEGVVDRNRDLYQGTAWPIEQIQDRNLFPRLIKSHVMVGDELFVVDMLKNKPPEVLREYHERLRSIAAKLQFFGAPEPYVSTLNSIAPPHGQKRSAPSAGGSSSKRPMK